MNKVKNTKYLGVLTAISVAVILPHFLSDYWIHSLTIAFYYVIMAASWNLLGGYTGQFSLSHHTFALLGGYTSALLAVDAGIPIWLGILAGGAVTIIIGLLLGVLCLRMRGIYLALTTWAFAEIVVTSLRMDYSFTGGDRGLITPLLFGPGKPPSYYYYLFLALAILTVFLIALIMRSRIGYYLQAIRNDETAAQVMGVDTVRWKVFAFTMASLFAGIAGAFYAHFIGLLSPITGKFDEMALIIVMVVIGGLRSQAGPVMGALLIRMLMEIFREWAPIRMVLLAIAVIVIMRMYNAGLMGVLRWIVWKVQKLPQEPGPVEDAEEG